MEIIKLVENSEISAKRTLNELGINRSTFYNWYGRYLEDGYDGLATKPSNSKRFWNRIPDFVKEQVVDIALEEPDKSPRELAYHITDKYEYFISESSVYRILKSYDLITSPAFILMAAGDKFKNPTRRVNELWQTDFTYFRIVGWGWYYLSTVLDDYSRYIISWKLTNSMTAEDVKDTLDLAIAKTGIDKVKLKHKPRLLSDNGPSYLSKDLKEYLDQKQMDHTRGAPYHPMTQGKIERYHRTMKNVVKLDTYYFPWELEIELKRFVDHYNNERYHESINNVTPADVFYGRHHEVLSRRERIKIETIKLRRKQNLSPQNNAQILNLVN
jgi:transposase InsO family protein/transposase-like protein